MQDVSTKLLGQFAECLESKIGEPAAIDDIAAAGAASTMPSPPAVPGSQVTNGPVTTSAPVQAAPSPPIAGTASAPTGEPAKSPTPSTHAANSDDDNVLDLGDIGLGKSLAKQYGAKVAGGAAGLLFLRWLLKRLRSSD